MLYLETLKKYVFLFLKVLAFAALFLLIYFFYALIFLNVTGEKKILISAILNYIFFLVNSFPLIVIASAVFFYAFTTNDKWFIIKVTPLISLFNSIILVIFFILDFNFIKVYQSDAIFYNLPVRDGYLNVFGPYRFYYETNERGKFTKGIVFYGAPFIMNGLIIKENQITVSASHQIGGGGVFPDNRTFNIKRTEKLISLKNSEISSFLLRNYETYLSSLRSFFKTTFKAGGIVISIISIYFLFTCFSILIAGFSTYFGKNDAMFLTISTLIVISILFFSILPGFLGLIHLIKLGLRNWFFEVLLPSLIVGIFSGMIGYGLLELKFWMSRMRGNK